MKFPEQFRIRVPGYDSMPGDCFGVFLIPANKAKRRKLYVIADDGRGEGSQRTNWEHISVSLRDFSNLCPSWEEMCLVKGLFWDDAECVVQYHPSKSDYVNVHPGVLHLWKQVGVEFAMPPKICV